jgi:hypothetical protein
VNNDSNYRTETPPPKTKDAWDEAELEFRTSQLTRIRATAEKWSTTITALLGVFSTVTMVGGTEELAKLAFDWLKWVVVVLTLAAAIFSALATIHVVKAAGGSIPESLA